MLSSRALSFSVKISTPVAWGAKTWTMPFLIADLQNFFWIFSDKSMKSISPRVVNL